MTRLIWTIKATLVAALLIMGLTGLAVAHPADELCGPDSGMDPALCRELQALDRGGDLSPEPAFKEQTATPARPLTFSSILTSNIRVGFAHILPMGVDHILFILALFLSSRQLKPLIWQVSAFTLAHTATLGLVAAGVLPDLPDIVEPLIALTIAWAALENILFKDVKIWRPILIFVFGLIHGMGFAGAFGELGLPPNLFWPALIGFNLGVEVGQLAILGMAFAAGFIIRYALRKAGRSDETWRYIIVWPVSALIFLTGMWWAVERAFL